MAPADILLHGPSKIYVDELLWFYPQTGIVTTYTVQQKDVHDHFDVFRGVDMIESAGQTGVLACSILLAQKEQRPISVLQGEFIMAFLGLGNARFHDFVKQGETLVNVIEIHRYKFRQISFSGTVYKQNGPAETKAYFDNLNEEEFKNGQLPSSFSKIADFEDYRGRAVKRKKIKIQL